MVLGEMLNNNQVELSENNLILLFYEFFKCLLSNLNSIFLDFGMQLLKNNTVKQHGNHHSGTWGDAEQESGGVVRKQLDFIVL